MNVFELPDFDIVNRYPLIKSDGSRVLESNLPFIFKNAMTPQQLLQLALKKMLDNGKPSSLKKASGSSIADDIDRNVKYYMFELADHFVDGKCSAVIRFSFNNRLFVELTEVKTSPTNTTADSCPSEQHTPLMCVHYMEATGSRPDKKFLKYLMSCDPRLSESYDVAPEVYDAIKTLLATNKDALSAACGTEWQKRYGRQAKLNFSPSFLIPLQRGVESVKAATRAGPSNKRTCNLPECNEVATKACARCRSAHYCSADHQKQDWKLHKKVCGKTAEELKDGNPNDLPDQSIVVPIKEVQNGNATLTCSNRNARPPTKITSFPKNIYATDIFIIKVQLSLEHAADGEFFAVDDGPILIYDSVRSFSFHLDYDVQPQHKNIFDIVLQRGLLSPTFKCNTKCRAFFYASRESRNIRILVDRPCPEQLW